MDLIGRSRTGGRGMETRYVAVAVDESGGDGLITPQQPGGDCER